MERAEIAGEALKAAPPVSVAAATALGVSLNDMVLAVTLLYVVLQIAFLLFKWHRMLIGDDDE